MKILFHVIDGIGLGHLSRQIAIGNALKELNEGIKILYFTENENPTMLHDFGFQCVKVPSPHGVYTNPWNVLGDEVNKLNESIFHATLQSYEPKVTVFDTYVREIPEWYSGKVTLVLRPNTYGVYKKEVEPYEHMFDLILVPSNPEFERLEDLSPLWEEKVKRWEREGKLYYTGRIVRVYETREREEVRKELGLGNEDKLVLVTTGGGSIGGTIYRTVVESMEKINGGGETAILLITGPFLPEEEKKNIFSKIKEGLIVREYVSNFLDYLKAADLVVTKPGYNTMSEGLYFGIPILCILSSDRNSIYYPWMRRLERLGLISVLEENNLDLLPDEINSLLDDEEKRREMSEKGKKFVGDNGAKNAAQKLLELLSV